MLSDEVLAKALLDRLLYKCEVIKLTGSRQLGRCDRGGMRGFYRKSSEK